MGWGRAGLGLIMIATLAACSGPQGSQARVERYFASLPGAVTAALKAQPLEVTPWTDPDSGFVYATGTRQIDLGDSAAPRDPMAAPLPLEHLVRRCQAAVRALAPTSARLYGRLPDDAPGMWQREVTSDLCARQVAAMWVRSDQRTIWTLKVGQPDDAGRARYTGIDLDVVAQQLTSSGTRGAGPGTPIQVTSARR